ncbi:MAG: hypothetical protein M9951_19030 [Burkholderiaceae bacterium]|nr:hypothetical protein [Burkholderiaceae bacterium]
MLTLMSAIPYIVTLVCAWANAGSAATTAAAISDFFIDQSPKFLESIGSLHAAATPRAWLLPIPGLKSMSFSPKSMGTQSSVRSGRPNSVKPVACQQQAMEGAAAGLEWGVGRELRDNGGQEVTWEPICR